MNFRGLTGEALDDGVDAADLGEVWRVVGRHQGGQSFLTTRPPRPRRRAGSPPSARGEREVVGDRDHALDFSSFAA